MIIILEMKHENDANFWHNETIEDGQEHGRSVLRD